MHLLLNIIYYSCTVPVVSLWMRIFAGVREGVLRKKFEHVREEITEDGENCTITNFVVCPQLRIWLGEGSK